MLGLLFTTDITSLIVVKTKGPIYIAASLKTDLTWKVACNHRNIVYHKVLKTKESQNKSYCKNFTTKIEFTELNQHRER